MNDAERLKKLIRFEVEPEFFDVELEEGAEEELMTFSENYAPDYHDLTAACENILRSGVENYTVVEWYRYVSGDIAGYYEGMWDYPEGDTGYLWPDNDRDQFLAMSFAVETLCEDDGFFLEDGEFVRGLKDIIESATNYESNADADPAEMKLTGMQKEFIIDAFRKTTDGVPDSRKDLFRKIIDEACEDGDETAMYIKGYSCYGGDRVYECDWEESRKWITKLFEKTEEPNYANTLGYIYYYGRCNGGVPEYEKAFQFFSIGAAYDLFESMYKLADMFRDGRGCIKSPETCWHIIGKIYPDSRMQFCYGSDADFADIALRKAAYFMSIDRPEEALCCYLEADYAIKKRMKKSNFFGNKKVLDGITKGIAEAESKISQDYFKDEVSSTYPYWFYDMMDGRTATAFSIENIEGNRYRITAKREKDNDVPKMLLVSPQLRCVKLTGNFSSEFIAEQPIEYKCSDRSSMYVNNIRYSFDEEYIFCNDEEEIFRIKASKYILRKKDFE